MPYHQLPKKKYKTNGLHLERQTDSLAKPSEREQFGQELMNCQS
jgi:hypothetical protein